MERLSQNQHEVTTGHLKEYAQRVADMYIQAAEQYLEDEDLLRSRITDYYSVRPKTEQELMHVLGKKSESELADYIQTVKIFTGDPVKFIERMEKLYELQDTHQRRREITSQDRLATDEEYKLGAYADVLESPVRDAVFAAQEKGYLTFQSGFKEKSDRDQFMDFYNRNIFIPKETLQYLGKQFIEVNVENLNDRTTLNLHPTGTNPVRLTQWKEIWDTLVESLPLADSETVPNMKLTGEHADFRRMQNSLRKQG